MNGLRTRERPTNILGWIAAILIFAGLNSLITALLHPLLVPVSSIVAFLVRRIAPQAVAPASAHFAWQLSAFEGFHTLIYLGAGLFVGNRLRRQKDSASGC